MDEPSSNLDTEAEQKLAQSLRDLSAERNVILVTHSTALLRAARSIIVLERGRIAASGPAAQVMAWLKGQGTRQQGRPMDPAKAGGGAP